VPWTRKLGHNTSTGQISEIARCLMERFNNTLRLQMQLARRTNIQIGLEIIRQRLLEDNLHIRRPATRPLLTAAHRQVRL
jgi:hypothetical protein